ncbi:TIGR02444 family protein [Pseudoalteromonas sp. T1lg65]|uniref:TIGR02444 family protein n=1 Tax=Pseudoalteromonas sp. T1lg65 TaxID=2077101 RepID=UPI003F7A7A19
MLDREAFWQFACHRYAQNGWQSKLLALQNEAGVNINLCLLLCYCDELKIQLTTSHVEALTRVACAFDNEILKPQRAIRAKLKSQHQDYLHYQSLKSSLLKTELELEKRQQDLLLNVLDNAGLNPQLSASNLPLYLGTEQIKILDHRYRNTR